MNTEIEQLSTPNEQSFLQDQVTLKEATLEGSPLLEDSPLEDVLPESPIFNSMLQAQSLNALPLQPASQDIWAAKYQLHDQTSMPLDITPDDTLKRIAKSLSDIETTQKDYWYEQFLQALRSGAMPAGRIIANAGAQQYKPATSTINCTVSATIDDSLDSILAKNHQAGLTLKAGCGIGYEFSTLRPKGAFVSGAGAYTSGPLSFMDIFDKMCCTVSSAGGRRGAQMATFDVGHPDVLAFIKAKREDARLRQFNLSLLISDAFMHAVKEDKQWPLAFPISQQQQQKEDLDLNDGQQVLWREWPTTDNYICDEKGQVACKITQWVRAKGLWDTIMNSNYDFAEPGFILIDKVNALNNNWFCEEVRATNPCGEQPLPPFGSCLLGSINLTGFVLNPFTQSAAFDWARFRQVVAVFTRMLDNVVEINGLPLAEQRHEIEHKRRHGMGYLGLGSTITMLCLKYGDAASLAFTEEVSKVLAVTGWQVGLELAKEKGAAPVMNQSFTVNAKMLNKRPQLIADGYKLGDKILGKVLHANYSHYMQKIAAQEPDLVAQLAIHGSRFTHHTSIAPTGTIALSLGNNVSNGIEPSFAHHYNRNIIEAGKKTKRKVDVYSYELLAYRQLINPQAMPYTEDADKQLPDYFMTADDIHPKQHVDVQAAAQQWIYSSISKTANIPSDYPYDQFKDIYLYAYEQGLKGCTTFRFNPEAFQGVLVKEHDLCVFRSK